MYSYVVLSFNWLLFSLHLIFNLINYTIANHKIIVKILCKCALRYIFLFQLCIFLPFIMNNLKICGDIESNPGPVNNPAQDLTVCHWNLNGIAAHNFVKISLLEAFNSVNNFDVICVSETFLDSTYSVDDSRLMIQGYAMIRSDHPSNTKRGGVCIYYREHLPFINRTDLTFIDECLVGEIAHKNSKCFVSCFYRSPNQTEDELNIFFLVLNRPVLA